MKRYIGDAVYVDFDGWAIVLTTEDGTPRATNRIVLEPEVYYALLEYVTGLRSASEQSRAAPSTAVPVEAGRTGNEPDREDES